MNVMAPAQSSFEEARRRHLIEATVEAVADVGFKAASLSQIARRANVSTGLYAHYFHDKDGLLEATLRFLAARLAAALREKLKAARTPRERLLAVVDAALGDQEFDRRTSAVWLAFWGQIAHSDRFQRIQYAYQRRLHTNLRHAFRTCVPADRAEGCATIVAGLIDGLWLQSHAYRDGASADQARATVHQVVFMLIEGSGRCDASVSPEAPTPAVGGSDAVDKPRGRRGDGEKLGERARRAAVVWTEMSPSARAASLRRCAQLVAEHGPSLARLDAVATGRPVITEVEFFIPRCVNAFEAAAERARAPSCVQYELGDGAIGIEIGAVYGGVVRAKAHRSAPLLDVCRSVADALSGGGALIIDVPLVARAVASEIEALLVKAGVPRGLVGIRFVENEPDGTAIPPSAAVILKGADVPRAIDSALSARDPSRRTPDLSAITLFVDKVALRAAQAAATAWCKRADVATRTPRDAETLQKKTPAAPVLRIVGFDNDDALLEMLDRTSFGAIAIFANDERRAERLARAALTAFCTINAYDLTCATARELPGEWASDVHRHAPVKRLLAFPGVRT